MRPYEYHLLCLTIISQTEVIMSIHRALMRYLSWKIGKMRRPAISAPAMADMHIAVFCLSIFATFYKRN